MGQILLNQRARQSSAWINLFGERKEEKNKDCCCADDVSLVHAHSDTCSWSGLIKSFTKSQTFKDWSKVVEAIAVELAKRRRISNGRFLVPSPSSLFPSFPLQQEVCGTPEKNNNCCNLHRRRLWKKLWERRRRRKGRITFIFHPVPWRFQKVRWIMDGLDWIGWTWRHSKGLREREREENFSESRQKNEEEESERRIEVHPFTLTQMVLSKKWKSLQYWGR